MTGLKHLEIEQRRILHHLAAVPCGMDGHEVAERVDLVHVSRYLRPASTLQCRILLAGLRQIIRHGSLAGNAPHHRKRAVPCHDVPPEPLDLLDADLRKVVSPHANDTRHQTGFYEVAELEICMVEKRRVDPCKLVAKREPCLIPSTRVPRVHIRERPGDDLDHVESFRDPVGCQHLEPARPIEPLGQTHPPGVAQPEKRCPVGMYEMTFVLRNTQSAVTY